MIMLLWACIGGKFGGRYQVDREANSTNGVLVSTETISDSSGLVELTVPIYSDDSTILLTVMSDLHVVLEEVYEPNGSLVLSTNDWYNSDQALTDAFFADSSDMVFNWPIRSIDPELEEGDWKFVFSTLSILGVYKGGRPATAYTQFKQDSSLSSGTISITVGLTPATEADQAVSTAIDEAISCWQELWTTKGIEVEVNTTVADINEDLPTPASSELKRISQQGSDTDILVLIGETVDNSDGTFGLAGSIPGALIATERSAVTVSWLEHAGLDASFSDSEIQTLCETMAHETGHYMGLYHPVESDFLEWDALEDTPQCDSQGECESEMSTNLLYPYPICSFGECIPQVELTTDQQGVLHRYLGTL